MCTCRAARQQGARGGLVTFTCCCRRVQFINRSIVTGTHLCTRMSRGDLLIFCFCSYAAPRGWCCCLVVVCPQDCHPLYSKFCFWYQKKESRTQVLVHVVWVVIRCPSMRCRVAASVVFSTPLSANTCAAVLAPAPHIVSTRVWVDIAGPGTRGLTLRRCALAGCVCFQQETWTDSIKPLCDFDTVCGCWQLWVSLLCSPCHQSNVLATLGRQCRCKRRMACR